MDAVDVILRVCLWGSVALIPILLVWALFGGRLSGSGKRSRPRPEPVRRRGFIPPAPRQGRPGQEISKSTTGEEGTSPKPDVSNPASGPKPKPGSGRGFILPPPTYDKPSPEVPKSAPAEEAPAPPPAAPKRPDDAKPEPMSERELIPPPPTTYDKPGREAPESPPAEEATSPEPAASKPPEDPRPEPVSGPGPIPEPPPDATPVPEDSKGAPAEEAPPPKPDPSDRLGEPAAQMEFISRVDFEARPLLNRPEYKILRILEAVAQETPGGLRVMAQTSLGEVLAPQPASGSQEARDLAFRSINSKRLDFLVIDAYGMPVLAVEYQGQGHFSETTFMRDAVKREALRKAGIRLLEVPAVFDAEDLERDIRKALPSNTSRRS